MDQRDATDIDRRLEAVLSGSASGATRPRQYFDAALVVSRDAMGNPVSRYGDISWNFSSQSADGTSGANLLFFEIGKAADLRLSAIIREQQKALMWLHIDAGNMRALKTIQRANWALAAWCVKAFTHRVELFELVSNPEWVGDELGTLNDNYLALTSGLIKTLWRHRSALGVDSVPLRHLKEVIAAGMKARPEDRQTPLIPSRTYCAILGGLISSMDEIERDLEVFLDAYMQSMDSSRAAPADALPAKRKMFRAKALAPVFERMKARGYDPSSRIALDQFIVGRINYYQSKLMHTVAAFSGMRISEVGILPLEGVFETFEDRGCTHYEIKGYTLKLNRGVRKSSSWITSREGHRAIVLAQRIGSTIVDVAGVRPPKGQQALLFASTASPFRRKNNGTIGTYQKQLIEEICPVITQEDIDELNCLELDRGWQREGIEVGNRWPLAFHQLRRSLSVYAHRSGMVSLPALKAQLQHITDEMRTYYADGYSRARNLVFDRDHVSHEWSAAKAESSYFGYTLGLLFSDDELIGRGAERMADTVSARSREETLRLFQQGKLTYKETVLGGCVSMEECKAKPLEPIPFDCLEKDCVNLVVFGKRLDYVIRTQETVVATLEHDESGSVEHRLEVTHLQVLLKARQKLAERAA